MNFHTPFSDDFTLFCVYGLNCLLLVFEEKVFYFIFLKQEDKGGSGGVQKQTDRDKSESEGIEVIIKLILNQKIG